MQGRQGRKTRVAVRRAGASALAVTILSLAVALPAAGVPATHGATAGTSAPVTIQVLSSRADLVSGANALVAVFLPASVNSSGLQITSNGHDVTSAFSAQQWRGVMTGLPAPNLLGLDPAANAVAGMVTGLQPGANVVRATLTDGHGAQMTLTNHPIGGPVFSGPQITPWACNPGATDAQCDRAPSYQYVYMPAALASTPDPDDFAESHQGDPRLQPYDPANPPPAATIAQTRTDSGNTVPFIVRIETGTIDRGQYQIAVLDNPAQPWTPFAPQAGWDHKVLMLGGPNCGVSYQEGSARNPEFTEALRRGFAVLTQDLMQTGDNCNLVTQAEALDMTKEYLAKQYGVIRYTMGLGGSGESIVQQWVADAYPGIYDGLIVEASFPDAWTTNMKADDCVQLTNYLDSPATWGDGVTWTPTQESALEGGDVPSSCVTWSTVFGGLFAPTTSASGVSASQQYNAQTNPCGVRTDIWDYSVDQFGRRPQSVWTAPEKACGRGFANRPLDNVGVQYGLDALRAGEISPAQFADLNAKIGGRDIDYDWQSQRTQADPGALPAIYRDGYVNEANNMYLPIIDLRSEANSELHDTYNSFVVRARLDRAHGNHANQVIWLNAEQSGFVVDPVQEADAFGLMNHWLDAVEADPSSASFAQKVVSDKPAAAADSCTVAAGQGPCPTPSASGSPRLAAGEPLTDDVWGCQLTPLGQFDYPVTFTPSERAELGQAFPTGVCDYSKAGTGEQPTIPWLTYTSGPAGQPLGPPPLSTPIGK